MARYTYEGSRRNEILFPLGGMGAGSISLDGSGRLRDWEIFNRPNKGSYNGFSAFFIRAEEAGRVIDARALHTDLAPPYTGRPIPGAEFREYGFGPHRHLLAGVPHFADGSFYGCFPEARLDFRDDSFPGRVALEAFSPFIPHDDLNSSLPAAFFTVCLTNSTEATLDYTAVLSLNNPFPAPRSNLAPDGPWHRMLLRGNPAPELPHELGTLAMATDAADISFQQYWYHGGWFDNLNLFWRDLNTPGPFRNRDCHGPDGEDVAVLAAHFRLAPGETRRVRFLIAWHVPHYWAYWKHPEREPWEKSWTNYYATRFADATAVVNHCMGRWDELAARTRSFRETLQSSTLPSEALEALTGNLAVLKSPTVLRLTDGEFYGWEGCHTTAGSCEGSCTHVWNYAFALPYLFPRLERSMRELDYSYNLRPDGGMPFRLQLPLGSPRSDFRPCVDGQMGGVLKVFREWKICGDTDWLRRWWPAVKKSLHYAWSPDNPDRWDPGRTGILTGRQHHTLDMELFGPNAWLELFYVAALRAAALMAEALGDPDAELYEQLAAEGRRYTEERLFNGEYFNQDIDVTDRTLLEPYLDGDTLTGASTLGAYWNEETGEIKYQIADGCHIDQVLAVWMAELCGVGEIVDRGLVERALAAIFRHNYLPSFRHHFNPCRIYGLNDEAGVVICTWPGESRKPAVPIPYAEESMHGFEYQVASHMIAHGMVDEGLMIVRSIRDRYDGEKRNPWNEFECGSNYARSLASWALLPVFSGFRCDLVRQSLGFRPLQELAEHRYFWAAGTGWGQIAIDAAGACLSVREGGLVLRRLELPRAGAAAGLRLGGEELDFAVVGDELVFDAVHITPERPLTLAYRA
ncbi:MAG: GH116 family glycosyl-hydrolase [Bacillota bacterium]|nr:GH116 family glycosyl-hydrolase [Bacillota bacterium]